MARKKKKVEIVDLDRALMDKSVYESIKNDAPRVDKAIADFDWDDLVKSPHLYVSNTIIKPLKYFVDHCKEDLNVNDYIKAYESFIELVQKVNEHCLYTPTLTGFCKYIYMSTYKFNALCMENSEVGDVFKQIKDYLSENLMQNMLTGRVKEVSGIFIAKANYGMRDSEPTNTNILTINTQTKSIDQILEELENNGL